MEDSEIVALYWSRSEQALAESARKYGAYCRSVACRILDSPEDGEECVNDVWLRAWETIPPRRPDRLGAFLGRIARNLALNRLRQRSAEKRGGGEVPAALEELAECVPAAGGVEQALEDRELAALLNRFLAGLKPEARRLFVGRYWYLCPVRELAEEYGCGESKVKMSLLRTRKQLRQVLETEGVVL